MKDTEAINLTAIMREEDILRISRTDIGFSVYLRGDILGTGLTVGDALANAVHQRDVLSAREAGRIAA